MKYNPGEDLHSWADRVKMYEHGYALQRIAKGEDVDQVLNDMSRRIVEKMMYPIVTAIKESAVEESKKEEATETKVISETPKGVADHVVD